MYSTFYFWVSSPDIAVDRVAERVRMGGHHIPEEVIRRRYLAGLRNFFRLYLPLADVWEAYDNRAFGDLRSIASGQRDMGASVDDPMLWERMKELDRG